jgi:inosine-uridine nucleoside N-ribohydrolase
VNHILQLLAGLGKEDVPVGFGSTVPLEGNNNFPEHWQQASDNFWDIEFQMASVTHKPIPAAELIVNTINESAQPVLLFISDTRTNLTEALRLDTHIEENIKAVYIMGGSV